METEDVMKTATVVLVVAAAAVAVYLVGRPVKRHFEQDFQTDPILDVDMNQLLSALNQVELIKQKLKKS